MYVSQIQIKSSQWHHYPNSKQYLHQVARGAKEHDLLVLNKLDYDIKSVLIECDNQTQGQVHEYLYLSTFKYTFNNTCTWRKYFLILAGVFFAYTQVPCWVLVCTCMYLHICICSCTVITNCRKLSWLILHCMIVPCLVVVDYS